MRLLLLVLTTLTCFSVPLCANSLRDSYPSARTQSCADECTGIVSNDLQFDTQVYNLGSDIMGSFDSLNPRVSDETGYMPTIDSFERGKHPEKKHHGRDPKIVVPESGGTGMLLMSALVLGLAFWRPLRRLST